MLRKNWAWPVHPCRSTDFTMSDFADYRSCAMISMRPNQTMKPTPKVLTHSLPLISTCRFAHLCRSCPRGSIRERLAPWQCNFSVLVTTASTSSRFPVSLVRFASSRSRTVFTKTESSASLGALAVLGTSRRKVRSLRTVPAVLFFNDSRGLSFWR